MYVSLHNRSACSFCSALTLPSQLAEFACAHEMPAIALTDRDGLYGAVAFQQACDDAGVKQIFGAELAVEPGIGITLLAMDLTGYANLCRLISRRHVAGTISMEDLGNHAAGLICLAGTANQRDPLFSTFSILNSQFTRRLYVELAVHRPEDAAVVRRRARLADELKLPVVATCESRCLHRSESHTLCAVSSIGTLTMLQQPHPDKPVGDWHLRTPQEMGRLFARRPDALANTLRIAEQCNVRLDVSQNRFPAFHSPDGRGAVEHLRELAISGCRRRYVDEPQQRGIGGKRPTMAEALERLHRELSIIEQVGYSEYFLVFHEIVQHCKLHGIATLARGSAADSLVCYALGVSHACPFRFDLPFDRFINPERARFSKMADIDLDLPWDQRDEVIRWVYDRWGHDRVAMIGCPNTFHARAAVADIGKVYGLPAHEVHRTTKLLPHVTSWNIAASIARSPEARHGIAVNEEPYRTILRMAHDLEGLPRHWAMHPCGLVVSPEPLTDLVPVQPSPKGMLVAQYDMDAIEDLGFVKIDLLGQAGLSVLRDAVESINCELRIANRGLNENIDLSQFAIRNSRSEIDLNCDIDYSDPPTWAMIATGNARGVHHIESPAMTSLLQQCNCRDIDCLTSVVSIIRPGGANQGAKEVFARRHQGMEQPTYAHPSLKAALEKTYGLMVFEEHILQVAVDFAGMNLGRADVLRRALNKENLLLIAELKGEFRQSALAHGRTPAEIDAVWPVVERFCGFMFNKAHSAEYAIEAFQGAWLKLRWPAHYLAAILSNYRGFYAGSPTLPQILYVLEALRLGIGFLPPCVNQSKRKFTIEHGSVAHQQSTPGNLLIRVPISHIQGLSEDFIARHYGEREKLSFPDVEDYLLRCRPSDSEVQSLLDCGALDCFGISRPDLFWRIRVNSEWRMGKGGGKRENPKKPNRPESAKSPPHNLLFANRCPEFPSVRLTAPDLRQIARREMELLGFPITLHPFELLGGDDDGNAIDWSRYVQVADLGDHHHCRATICGLMVADRINATRTHELMKFVTLGDRTGFVETLLFPDAYQRFGHLTVANPILEATGIVEPFENNNGFTFRVLSLSPPAKCRRKEKPAANGRAFMGRNQSGGVRG